MGFDESYRREDGAADGGRSERTDEPSISATCMHAARQKMGKASVGDSIALS